MTFKSLFFNLQLEDLKRRLGSVIFAVMVFFICLPVYCVLKLSSDINGRYDFLSDEEVRLRIILRENAGNVSFGNIGLIFIVCICAVVFAAAGFSYLHSKKKVDFYHSIPVRKEMHFFVRYINGILIFMIPYLISLLLTFLIFQIRGYMELHIFKSAMAAFLLNTTHFLLLYSVAVAAVMLAGNVIVSVIAIGALYGLAPLIRIVLLLHYTFFSTYMQRFGDITNILAKTKYLSPVSMLLYNIDKYGADSWQSGSIYEYAVPPALEYFIMIIIVIVLCLTALFLYKKRDLAKAGTAIVFRIIQPIVKFLVVIPGALLCGMVFYSFNDGFGFYIFGTLLGALILCGIIEIIYHFDVKKVFTHKLEFGIVASVCIIIGIIFKMDLFGYDTYLPEKDEIAGIGLSIGTGWGEYQILREYDSYTTIEYNSRTEYQLNDVSLTNIELIYPLLQYATENVYEELDEGDYPVPVMVKYVLNNGKTAYREYYVSEKANKEVINRILTDKEYYEGAYLIYQIPDDAISRITYSAAYTGVKELALTSDEMKEFMQIYKDDLGTVTLDILDSSYVKSELYIWVYLDTEYRLSYPILSTCKNTIAYLERRGYSLEEEYNLDEIESVSINLYAEDNSAKPANEYYDSDGSIIVYTDKSKIKDILPYLAYNYYYFYHRYMYNDTYVNMRYKTKDASGDAVERNYYLYEIPEFLIEDMKKQ